MVSTQNIQIARACPDIRGMHYRLIKPTKSFFSPINGIPAGTVLTLTGDILIEVAMKYRIFAQSIMPKATVKIGVAWGKNMKGTDWVTLTRFQRNAVAVQEPAQK